VGCVLASLGHSQACVKDLGAQHSSGTKIWFSEKVDLVGMIPPLDLCKLVDQSSPDFVSPNAGEKAVDT